MDLKEEFKSEWRKKFISAPLPDMRCFAVVRGQHANLFDILDRDEKELKEKLDQATFSYSWIVKKKEELKKAIDNDSEEYANLASSSKHKAAIPRLGSIGRRSTDPALISPITRTAGILKKIPLSVVAPVKSHSSQENNVLISPTGTNPYLLMRKRLIKLLSVDECKDLSYHFCAVTFDLRANISSASSFLDLLQSLGAISEHNVDDLAGALDAEKLHSAVRIVTTYQESIDDGYLVMIPIKTEKVDPVASVVSDDDLKTLSVKIADSFKTFGRDVLKFTAKEIEKWQRLSDEADKQACKMLLKWKQRLGHRATTAQLSDLLKEFNYGPDVWGFLEGMPADDPLDTDDNQGVESYQSIVIKGHIKSSPDELSIKKGDKIMIQDRGRVGWYYGEVMNQHGWVPNYCVREEDGAEKQFRFLFVVETTTDSGRWEENFLTYRQGELLDVIEETYVKSNALYRARNKDGFIGFLPTTNCNRIFRKESILSEREWFHPKLMRHQADRLLRSCPQGAYLIREASKPGDFVLNLKSAVENTNFLIKTTNFGYKISDKKFKSIREIIDYYKRVPIKDNVCLTSAVSKR